MKPKKLIIMQKGNSGIIAFFRNKREENEREKRKKERRRMRERKEKKNIKEGENLR